MKSALVVAGVLVGAWAAFRVYEAKQAGKPWELALRHPFTEIGLLGRQPLTIGLVKADPVILASVNRNEGLVKLPG